MAEEKKTETVDTAPKAVKEEKKKDAKSSKPGLGAKIKKFFKDYKSEMKKSTGLVIVCLVVVSAVISLLDLGLSNLILWLGSLV